MKESKRCEGTLFLGYFFIGGGKPASSVKVNNIFVVQNQRKREAMGTWLSFPLFLGVWYEI